MTTQRTFVHGNSSASAAVEAELHVANFGAVGDGTTDDGPALQAALDAASLKGVPLRFGAKPYGTNQKLRVNAQLELLGSSGTTDSTSIRALSKIPAVMEFNTGVRVSQITFDGDFKAGYAALISRGNHSVFQTCVFTRARIDGAYLDGDHTKGNYYHMFRECNFRWNGTIYYTDGFVVKDANGPITQKNGNIYPDSPAPMTNQVPVVGTISTTAGSDILVGTGTKFMSDLKEMRRGDFITVRATAATVDGKSNDQWFQLVDVIDDTHLTIMSHLPPTTTASGLDYRVGIGDGYHEMVSTDNNNHNIENCRSFGNAGCGLMCRGTFGVRVDGFQGDYNNAHAICVGHANDGVVLNSSFSDLYFEKNGADAPMFLSYANGITIDTVNCDIEPIVKVSHEAFATGYITNYQGISFHFNQMKPIGGFISDIPVSALAPNVYAQGAIFGQNQFNGGLGNGSLTIKDQDGAMPGWSAVSGSLNDATAVAFDLKVKVAFVTAGATVLRLRNGPTVVLRADLSGNLRLAGSLGIGNSAAATTPGSVVRKIEIFDTSGTSLGFIPLYDAIT